MAFSTRHSGLSWWPQRGTGCALRMCGFDGAEAQQEAFQADFPAAEIVKNPEAVQIYAEQLTAFLESRTLLFAPRLEILSGTAFQREVWAELQTVQPGQTVSYTELATRIGRPSAIRAVGSACASNGLAIAIPCHRAMRQDGSLAGYRWGLDWKKRLLALESGIA